VELRTALRNDPGEVERARNLVGASLRRWGLPDDGGVAALLVTELVTNALRYGAQPMRMVAKDVGAGLRVEIHDARVGEPPRLRPTMPESSHGRGMMLVDALASRWGWSEFGGEKQVWFELDLADAPMAVTPSAEPEVTQSVAADADEVVAA
jgi:anti-sigma regulatory factor (Ser/Thr protein kinase)